MREASWGAKSRPTGPAFQQASESQDEGLGTAGAPDEEEEGGRPPEGALASPARGLLRGLTPARCPTPRLTGGGEAPGGPQGGEAEAEGEGLRTLPPIAAHVCSCLVRPPRL
jgi:hypothetical protein